jgi:hypothetical protein
MKQGLEVLVWAILDLEAADKHALDFAWWSANNERPVLAASSLYLRLSVG